MVTMTVMVVVTVSDGDDDDHDDDDDDTDGDLIQYCLIHFLEGQPSTPRRGEKVLGFASTCIKIYLLVSKCFNKYTFLCQTQLSCFFSAWAYVGSLDHQISLVMGPSFLKFIHVSAHYGPDKSLGVGSPTLLSMIFEDFLEFGRILKIIRISS